MRNLAIVTLALIFLSGCKQELDEWDITYPAEIEDQIMLFKEYTPSGLKARRLTIVLIGNDLRSKEGMRCAGLSSQRRKKIYLDTTSTHWIESKTSLVLHELGHYVLDRHHNERFFYHHSFSQFSIPVSVMTIQPKPTDELLKSHPILKDYYLNELINGSN